MIMVWSEMLCAVVSHCFTDCTYAWESSFFVQKLMACTTKYRTIILITNSITICIIYRLFESQFHDFTWITEVETKDAHGSQEYTLPVHSRPYNNLSLSILGLGGGEEANTPHVFPHHPEMPQAIKLRTL